MDALYGQDLYIYVRVYEKDDLTVKLVENESTPTLLGLEIILRQLHLSAKNSDIKCHSGSSSKTKQSV